MTINYIYKNMFKLNSMNVIIRLCHSLNGKVGSFHESLVLEKQAFIEAT